MFRFLIGSSLLFVGTMVMAAGAITLIGLPVGIFMLGAGLQLLVGEDRGAGRRGSPREAE
jgi:hypothetical protein